MNIKKRFLALVVIVLPLLSSADEHFADIALGYSSNVSDSLYTTKEKCSGVYLDGDIMKTTNLGFVYGIGIDANTWTARDVTGIYSSGYTMYTAGASAKIGYAFENKFNIPIKLKTGIGYGVVSQGKHNGYGKQYEGSLEYIFFEGIGFGLKYKHAEATILKHDMNFESTIAYFSFPIG